MACSKVLLLLLIVTLACLIAEAIYVEFGKTQEGSVKLVERKIKLTSDLSIMTFNKDKKYPVTIDKVEIQTTMGHAYFKLLSEETFNQEVNVQIRPQSAYVDLEVTIHGRMKIGEKPKIKSSDVKFS